MKARTSPSKRFHPPAFEDPSMPAQHRTSYDWLQPSFAAASHHGPPERIMPEIMSWSPSDEGEGKDGKGKKSHKRRPDNAPPGPGKAWRKGLKKWVLPRAMIADGRGMPIPWREGGAFLGDLCPAYPIGTLPGQATPRSQEGTPEPGECIAPDWLSGYPLQETSTTPALTLDPLPSSSPILPDSASSSSPNPSQLPSSTSDRSLKSVPRLFIPYPTNYIRLRNSSRRTTEAIQVLSRGRSG